MNNRKLLSGVGIFALAGALGASPAFANEGSAETASDISDTSDISFRLEPGSESEGSDPTKTSVTGDRVSMTPLNSFSGLDTAQYNTNDFNVTIGVDTNFRVARTEDELIGSITDPEQRLLVRDDVGVDFGDPDNVAPYAVQIFIQRNSDGGVFFNCTGSVINPRTILTAAHCVNGSEGPIATISSETYGLPGEAETTLLIATGQSSADRLFTYIGDGSGYEDGGVASSTDVIIHPTANPDNTGLGFPWADVALIAVDAPITDVPALPLLLTPLTELTHVLQVGYGTNGTGTTGGTNAGSRFLRRVGENMLGLVGSTGDFIDGVFPDVAPATVNLGFESQSYYWTDFDNPDRTPEESAGCTFPGATISCDSLGAVFAIDFFDGDALPGEAGTGPGDSGSPLVADQLAEFPLGIGVLSGGFDFFNLGGTFSDVSFYNPLYPFFEFITENTAYKYVSAVGGDGNWSDGSHWALLGAGSTGFVPQNTDGTVGTAFANPAQYFEVHLNNAGRTTVDLDVEIDKLVVNNADAELFVDGPFSFTVIQDIEQFGGFVEVDGTVNTPFYFLLSGELGGADGTINTNALLNVAGLVSAGGIGGISSMAINGDFLQTSAGTTWVDFTVDRRRNVTNDTYNISGVALLGGDLVVSTSDRRVRFGSEFTVLSAGEIDGEFDEVFLLGGSPILAATQTIDGGDVVVTITARSIRDLLGRRSSLRSLGSTLDTLRSTRFDQFTALFDVVDNAGIDTLGSTLTSLTPINAFNQTFTANSFSQRFTGQLSQRSLALRGGSRAAGGFSAAGNASFALASGAPVQTGGLGVFGSASGVFLNGGQQSGLLGNGTLGFAQHGINGATSGVIGANAFEQASLTQAGELTIGADVAVSEGFSFGVAVSNIRNSQQSTGALTPQEDRSQSVAIYASLSDGGLFADGYAGASDQAFGIERTSQGDFATDAVSAFSNAIGQSEGSQTFGGVRFGYAFDLAKGFEIGPVVSMDYVRSQIGGYDELGAGALGLSVADRSFTSLGAKAGAMASFEIANSEGRSISAFGSVAYARELADTSDVVTAHFFGAADTPFSIANQLDGQWVSVNAGAEMEVGSNMRASISVTSDMGRGALSNDQAQASVSWRF